MALTEHALSQQREVNRLSLLLRKAYYKHNTNSKEKFTVPFGGSMTESIGAWPEFILRGTFCKRSCLGFCSPCFYSKFPISNENRQAYLRMVETQVMYVVNDFERLVINKQFGNDKHNISLVLTPTGSFFDEFEFPIDIRLKMERGLVAQSEKHSINIALHIESHCEDFVEYDIEDEKSKEEIELLKRLNTRIVFGFESADEYVRNVLYNKRLAIETFESAIARVKKFGLTPGAFVFAGLFALNAIQTKKDVINTIKYLLNKDVFPVLMFQNAQSYTITDVLLKEKAISLIEPLTVAEILAEFVLHMDDSQSYWLVADPVGGPPEPDIHIFKESQMTCKSCSELIYDALVQLRLNRDTQAFRESWLKIKKCTCFSRYESFMMKLPQNLEEALIRTDQLLEICSETVEKRLGKADD